MDRLIATYSVALGSADTYPVSGTPQYATDGNPETSTPATLWPAYAWNMLQEEIRYVITQAGITPVGSNWTQLWQAIRTLGAIRVTDTGTANAMVITLAPVPANLAAMAGQIFVITKSASGNTGAVTINPNGLGATALFHPDGNPIGAGEYPAASIGLVLCTGTEFVLLNRPSIAALVPFSHTVAPATAYSAHGIYLGASYNGSVSVMFTAPADGTISAGGSINQNEAASAIISAFLYINGTLVDDDTCEAGSTLFGDLTVTKGTVCTISYQVTTTADPGVSATYRVGLLNFVPSS